MKIVYDIGTNYPLCSHNAMSETGISAPCPIVIRDRKEKCKLVNKKFEIIREKSNS